VLYSTICGLQALFHFNKRIGILISTVFYLIGGNKLQCVASASQESIIIITYFMKNKIIAIIIPCLNFQQPLVHGQFDSGARFGAGAGVNIPVSTKDS
jgi:hypothetical protein